MYWNPDCLTLPLVYHKKPHQSFSIQNCSSLNCGCFIVAALLTYLDSELRCLKQGPQRDLFWGAFWVLPPILRHFAFPVEAVTSYSIDFLLLFSIKSFTKTTVQMKFILIWP